MINLVCCQCSSVNRVPEAKLQDNPVCGKCKQQLLPTHPVELTDDNFDKYISRTDLPVVIDFWAPWCGPCRMMAPSFAAAAAQLSPRFILAKLNTDAEQRSASPFNITGIPTMILFHQGREVTRVSGALNTQQIIQWAKKSIS